MRTGEPSRTAYGAAMHRAMHQELEGGRIFRDPLAWRILGTDYDAVVASGRYVDRKPLRIMIAVRHRFAEDRLADAIDHGTRQVVVLGAGLDTFAYRNPHPDVVCYEVDFPATGAWKQQRLAAAGIADPPTVRRVGVDFEADDDLLQRLIGSGFDPGRPAFFLWLGVVVYLTPEAVRQTLQTIAGIPGSEVVFDYTNPAQQLSERGRSAREHFSDRVRSAGEPMVATFDTAELHDLLSGLGFGSIIDLDRNAIRTRFLGLPSDGESGGAHVLSARVG